MKHFIKKINNILLSTVIFLVLTFGFSFQAKAQYVWPSGYKYRSTESNDSATEFKNTTPIIGGSLVNTLSDFYAAFPVYQGNWASTGDRCKNRLSPELDVMFSQSVAADVCPGILNDGNPDNTYSDEVVYEYTCNGDVSYNLRTDNNLYQTMGGDTMYGAWSMIFSFFPPVNEDNCGATGSCFVGNAFVIDTRAQNEAHPGLFPGFGVKVLQEGPGEVYYLDQIRSMVQAPIQALRPYNRPVVVGQIIPGFLPVATGDCDGSLFATQFGDDATRHTFSTNM